MSTNDVLATDSAHQRASAPISPSVEELRQPILDYAPEDPAGNTFRSAMLGFADLLEELWDESGEESLEADVIWTVLQAFPGLITSMPSVEDLGELFLGGHLIDGVAADTLYTLGCLQSTLQHLQPTGLVAVLWRAALLAIYRLMAVFIVFDDAVGIEQCRQLLGTTERLAERLAGRG